MKIALTALLLVVALGLALPASAETLEAKIPFAFRVADRTYEPGTYSLMSVNNMNRLIYQLHCQSTGRGEFLRAGIPAEPAKNDTQALIFQCVSNNCALMTVRLNDRSFTLPKSDWQPSTQIQAENRVEGKIVVAMK